MYCWGALPDDVPGTASCPVSSGGKGGGTTYVACAASATWIPVGVSLGSDTLLVDVAGDCALTTEGGVLCTSSGTSQFRRVAMAGSFVSIEAGEEHYCGLTLDGVASCWGENHLGQLGARDTTYEPEPIEVVPWPLADIDELIQREDFAEARAVAALHLVQLKLNKEKT